MSVVWYLKGLEGQYEGEELTLAQEVIWLGRAVQGTPNKATHIFFEDGSVSRVHGAIAWTPEYSAFVIHHRSQTNPTFLNDAPVTQPQLLKPDDVLSFGHQRVQVRFREEEASSSETSAPAPESVETGGPVTFCFKHKGVTKTLDPAPSVVLEFTPSITALEESNSPEESRVKIPARKEAVLTFTAGSGEGSYKLSISSEKDVTTRRTTESGKLSLEVPFSPGAQVKLGALDRIHHQGTEIWPEGAKKELKSESTVEMDSETFQNLRREEKDKGLLEFRNGAWKGVHVTIYPGDAALEVGPGRTIAGYDIPIEDGPVCRVFYQDDTPHIEVVEAVEGQYVSVNGELLFSIQANPLISGSGIFLGKTMLHWTQPELQKKLSSFKLQVGDDSIPVSRALMRIGSASHCEILLEEPGISGVTGSLEYTPEGFYYKHLDGAYPAEVDGEVAISGDRVQVSEGSTIQFGSDSSLKLIKK